MPGSWRDVAFARQEKLIRLGPLTINVLLQLYLPTEKRNGLITLGDPERWEHLVLVLWMGEVTHESAHVKQVDGAAVWLQKDSRKAWRFHWSHLWRRVKEKLWGKSG